MGHPEYITHSRSSRHAPRARRQAALCAVLVVVVAACALAAAVAAAPAAAAPSLFDLQKEAKRTRAEMANLQTDLQQAGNDLARAQAQLDEVTQRLQTARTSLARAQQRPGHRSGRSSPSARRSSTRPAGSTGWTSSQPAEPRRHRHHPLAGEDLAEQDRKNENKAQR